MAARMLHRGNSEYRRPFGVAISAPARNGYGRRHSAGNPSRRKRESARVLGYPDRAPLFAIDRGRDGISDWRGEAGTDLLIAASICCSVPSSWIVPRTPPNRSAGNDFLNGQDPT
jgi:hypothetical protein